MSSHKAHRVIDKICGCSYGQELISQHVVNRRSGFSRNEKLRNDVQNVLNYVDRKLHISIEKVVKPYRKPNILSEYISLQLEKRVPFIKTMKKVIELVEWE
jgi:ribosomal protein S3